jgi:hypothetical protein
MSNKESYLSRRRPRLSHHHAVVAVALLLVPLVVGFSGCCTPQKIGSVAATWHIPQHTNMWCWAASTEMVSAYLNHRVDQCESSKFVHNNPTDCTKGCPGYCSCWGVCSATISQIMNNWTHWKFSYLHTASHLSWADIKTSCNVGPCDNSPVQVIWWWTGGGGHVVTAYGYAETSAGNFVSYFNPWPPDCTTPTKTCSSSSTSGGEDAVATYDWMVSTADKTWGDSFSKFKYVGP